MRTAPSDVRGSTVEIAGRVNGDGTTAVGVGFTIQRVATGNYTIRFDRGRIIALTPTPSAATFYIGTSATFNGGQASITIFNSTTGASTDVAFSFKATLAL